MTLTAPIADTLIFSHARADAGTRRRATELADKTAAEIGYLTHAFFDLLAQISAGALNAAANSASGGRDCFDELIAKLPQLSVAARRDPEALARLKSSAEQHVAAAEDRFVTSRNVTP
ncbi:hypothetical protein AB0C34_17325 [Nocardia sp. NPDC049220]|uniref:hypothetical protein n=1 Tax=Nocardia sp. NPDC049220 TaxID=3155273 RepID=UPI0033E0BB33